MKKYLFMLILLTFILSACNSNKLISDDFKKDIDQVVPVIEKSHKKQEDYTEKELDLINSFKDKYKYGQFENSDDNNYEMNDLEKAVYHQVSTMHSFAIEIDSDKETTTLASEENNEKDFYKEAKNALDELMSIKNIENLPNEFKDKYPTYEKINGIYPEQFEKDIRELLEFYEPIINGSQTDVNDEEWELLEKFLIQYKGDQDIVLTDYKQEGKYYIINSSMEDVIKAFDSIRYDIDEGYLQDDSVEKFNTVKEDIDLFGTQDLR